MRANENTRYVIGIDPGMRGGIALLENEVPRLWWKIEGCSIRDLWIILGGCAAYKPIVAYIEDLHATNTSYVANWKLGRNYGHLEALLTAHQIATARVKPKMWQGEYGLARKTKNETDTQKKNRHKAIAEELFPNVEKVTHAIADALLIAEWGRRHRAAIG